MKSGDAGHWIVVGWAGSNAVIPWASIEMLTEPKESPR